jgi:hypothetical protein
VSHSHNPSNSGGRDQENYCGSSHAQANSAQDPIGKNTHTHTHYERAGEVAQGVGQEDTWL